MNVVDYPSGKNDLLPEALLKRTHMTANHGVDMTKNMLDRAQEERTLETGKLQPSTMNVLRQTQFMGKPLLVEEHPMSVSSIALPTNSPSAEQFAAIHPQIGHVTSEGGRRHSLFLRVNKEALSKRTYEKLVGQSAPSSEPEPTHSQYPSFSYAKLTTPATWPAYGKDLDSELFMSLATSPEHDLQTPIKARPLLGLSNSTAFQSAIGSAHSTTLDEDAVASRRFSFEFDTLPDWDIIERSMREPLTESRGCYSPKINSSLNGHIDKDELFFDADPNAEHFVQNRGKSLAYSSLPLTTRSPPSLSISSSSFESLSSEVCLEAKAAMPITTRF